MVATSDSAEDTRHPAVVNSEQGHQGLGALSDRTDRQLSDGIPVEDRFLLTVRGVDELGSTFGDELGNFYSLPADSPSSKSIFEGLP